LTALNYPKRIPGSHCDWIEETRHEHPDVRKSSELKQNSKFTDTRRLERATNSIQPIE